MDAYAQSNHKAAPSRWGPERRQEFIDFRLLWNGTINRKELVDFFGISIQQASSDLARYTEQVPANLVYDRRAKTYRATPEFKPLVVSGDAQHFLNQLSEIATRMLPTAASSLFIGWSPPCDVIRYPARPVETRTLLHLLWAIRDGNDVQILYQSMRRPAATKRWIGPHALASDGMRWHVRAWCHERAEFRDFVLSRIQLIGDTRQSAIDPAKDEHWHSYIDVIIGARPELSEGQRSAIEADFGMHHGRLALSCRKALVFYLLRQLKLETVENTSALEQPLQLLNRSDFVTMMEIAKKVPEGSTVILQPPEEVSICQN